MVYSDMSLEVIKCNESYVVKGNEWYDIMEWYVIPKKPYEITLHSSPILVLE